MALAFPLPIILLLFLSIPLSESRLSLDYYKKSCPGFDDIIRDVVSSKQSTTPTTAAATLRVFFHDCMVEGCDASVLVASNSFNLAERDADLNKNLPGDAFDVVMKAKLALEVKCPKIVSCADILAQVTRDLVIMVGGPFYDVRLGRKDGLISKAANVPGNLPTTNMTMDQMIQFFKMKGFEVKEMVALMGGHTIGFSHCKEFAARLYHYSKTTPTDPGLNPKFAEALKKFCSNYTKDPTMSAFNDVLSPGKFDNMYYQNLPRGLGLLRSDHILNQDSRTRPFVEQYAANQKLFYDDFSHAMEKLSVRQIKTGKKGEVRSRCDQFNSIKV
ncbi:peroxidase 65-like [Mercurialis annua]|uniref:peroxidase 65-like n=1 Tax=Mercurialis annua TaxID=3986 RepID=UPI00215FF3F9|nr:peroxidase 65-like [Mercurialis annua]